MKVHEGHAHSAGAASGAAVEAAGRGATAMVGLRSDDVWIDLQSDMNPSGPERGTQSVERNDGHAATKEGESEALRAAERAQARNRVPGLTLWVV